MPLDLDKIQLTSSLPAYMNVESGQFIINVAGSLASSATTNVSNSITSDTTKGSIKVYLQQTPVPSDVFTIYGTNTLLPVMPWGNNVQSPLVNIGCSVSGNPSVASQPVNINLRLTTTGISATITVTNPYAGTMTLTSTTFTFRYSIFAPTYVV